MKLHLPNTLLSLVASTICVTSAFAENVEVEKYDKGNKITDLAIAPYLPSAESNIIKYEKIELSGNEKMGLLDANGNFVTLGQIVYKGYSLFGAGYFKIEGTAGNVTQNVQVNEMLIKGNSQVQLGGQVKFSATGTDSYDEFTGLIAGTVDVSESGSLSSWNAIIDNLTVSGNATVNIHTQRGEGNMGYRLGQAKDSKQVQIKQTLTVNGGNVTIGNVQYNNHTNSDKASTQNPETDYHTVTAFGSYTYEGNPSLDDGKVNGVTSADRDPSLIVQTGGTLTVAGKSLSVGGLNIDQQGGKMSISNGGKHFIADYGDSDIRQNSLDSNTSLVIGEIKAFNTYYDNIMKSLEANSLTKDIDPTIALTHSGAGTVTLNGVNFTEEIGSAKEHSTITQNDYVAADGTVTTSTGTINLNGKYQGVTFDITQTGGGKINLNSDIQAGKVEQSGTGTITVAAGKTLTAESIEITGGTLVNNGTINLPTTEPVMLLAEGDDIAALDNTENLMNLVITGGQLVNYGTLNGSIVVEGGILELLDGNVGDITLTTGDIIVKSDSNVENITLNGGSITFENGSVLTVTNGVELNGATVVVNVDSIEDIVSGAQITLFDDATGTLEFNNTVITFVDAAGEETQATVNGAATGGSVTVNTVIPEPTTATLSLLALAALAGRRRRR